MDNANYVFTETEVKPNVNYAKSLPLDEILSLGNKIWNEVKSNPDFNNEKKSEELYYSIYNKYHDFGSSFPLILRWMVQMQKYSSKAFNKFLRKYSTSNISSKKDFLILQADYIVYLFEENNHYDKKCINTYREFIIKQLLDEEEQIKQIDIEMKKELEDMNKEKRKRLYDYIKNQQKYNVEKIEYHNNDIIMRNEENETNGFQ